MTTVENHVLAVFERSVRDRAAPGTVWRTACDRTLELVRRVYGEYGMNWDGPMLLDGTTALALGIYLVSRTTGPLDRGHEPIGDVRRQQIDTIKIRDHAARVQLWQVLLRAAGHDPAAPDDPVAEVWRKLTRSMGEPEVPEELLTTTRGGWPLGDGLNFALAPMWNLDF